MIDLEKKGTIILSRYRSGGTQLLHILEEYYILKGCKCENLREFDIVIDDGVDSQINKFFNPNDSIKKVILLNNPKAISYFEKIGYFEKLLQDYNIIFLNRKDKEKNLLSLPLWECLIHAGLYDYEGDDVEDRMKQFHEELIQNPISYRKVYLGHHIDLIESQYENHLNLIIYLLLSEWRLIESISNKYGINEIYYEEYEYKLSEFLTNKFGIVEKKELDIFSHLHRKINYISSDYRIYFDEETNKILDIWNLNE